LLDRIEGIVRESVKPMEKIEGIRILHVDGLNGGGGSAGGGGGSPTDEIINSALRYRVQAPMIDQVLKEIGIDGSNLSKMGGLMREASDLQRVAKDASQTDGKSASGSGSGKSSGSAKPRDADAKKSEE
jgi:hypothetical protein